MGQGTPDTAFLHQMVIAVVGRDGNTPSAQAGLEQDHNQEKKANSEQAVKRSP